MSDCRACYYGHHLECDGGPCQCDQCITDVLRGAVRQGRRTVKEMQAAMTTQPERDALEGDA